MLSAVQQFTDTHLLLYAAVGVAASFLAGYAASLLLPAPQHAIQGLTIYTLGEPLNEPSREPPQEIPA